MESTCPVGSKNGIAERKEEETEVDRAMCSELGPAKKIHSCVGDRGPQGLERLVPPHFFPSDLLGRGGPFVVFRVRWSFRGVFRSWLGESFKIADRAKCRLFSYRL